MPQQLETEVCVSEERTTSVSPISGSAPSVLFGGFLKVQHQRVTHPATSRSMKGVADGNIPSLDDVLTDLGKEILGNQGVRNN